MRRALLGMIASILMLASAHADNSFFAVGKNYLFHIKIINPAAPNGAYYYGHLLNADEYGNVTLDHVSYTFTFNPGYASNPPVVSQPFVRLSPNAQLWWNKDFIMWGLQIPSLP